MAYPDLTTPAHPRLRPRFRHRPRVVPLRVRLPPLPRPGVPAGPEPVGHAPGRPVPEVPRVGPLRPRPGREDRPRRMEERQLLRRRLRHPAADDARRHEQPAPRLRPQPLARPSRQAQPRPLRLGRPAHSRPRQRLVRAAALPAAGITRRWPTTRSWWTSWSSGPPGASCSSTARPTRWACSVPARPRPTRA